MTPAEYHLTDHDIHRFMQAHNLPVTHLTRPRLGSINPCWIVDDMVVVRLDPSQSRKFAGEARAYQLARQAGVPVPDVVALDMTCQHVPCPGLITTFCSGEPMIERWPHLDPAQQAQVAESAGRALARLHSIAYTAFGNLRDDETGAMHDNWWSFVHDFFERFAGQAATISGFPTAELAQARAALHARADKLSAIAQPALVHSDFHCENLLITDDGLSAVLDFEWALAGDPAWDFIVDFKWEQMCPGSARHIRAGYASVSPFSADHQERVLLYQILLHVETIAGWPDYRDEALERLRAVVMDLS